MTIYDEPNTIGEYFKALNSALMPIANSIRAVLSNKPSNPINNLSLREDVSEYLELFLAEYVVVIKQLISATNTLAPSENMPKEVTADVEIAINLRVDRLKMAIDRLINQYRQLCECRFADKYAYGQKLALLLVEKTLAQYLDMLDQINFVVTDPDGAFKKYGDACIRLHITFEYANEIQKIQEWLADGKQVIRCSLVFQEEKAPGIGKRIRSLLFWAGVFYIFVLAGFCSGK